MKCREVVELMTDYLEGVLPERDRQRFEAHIADCAGCREYLAQLRRTIRIAGRLNDEPLPPALESELVRAFRDWRRPKRT